MAFNSVLCFLDSSFPDAACPDEQQTRIQYANASSQGTFNPNSTHGQIWIYDYTTSTSNLTPLDLSTWPDHQDFHPLGLAYDSKTESLYAINHARSGSRIDIFTIDWTTNTATHTQTLTHPLLHAPNALELLGDGKMYVTNDHAIRAAVSPLLSQIETFSGLAGGSVVYMDVGSPSSARIVARVPFANGLALLNSTVLAVASSSKAGVYMYSIGRDHELEFHKLVRTPAGADNLSVDGHGVLLVAGHPFAPALMGVAKRRAGCEMDGTGEKRLACRCDAPSWVGEWSEERGLMTVLVSQGQDGEGRGVCSSSTAVRDVGRRVGLVSMLYGRGIGVFRV